MRRRPSTAMTSSKCPSVRWPVLPVFVLLLLLAQQAPCHPASDGPHAAGRAGRSLLRIAPWSRPWYPASAPTSSWNMLSLPVAARLQPAPLAAPMTVWQLMTPLGQHRARDDYPLVVSLAAHAPASGRVRPAPFEWVPSAAPAMPATTPTWLRLVTGGTPLYDLVETATGGARRPLVINRAAGNHVPMATLKHTFLRVTTPAPSLLPGDQPARESAESATSATGAGATAAAAASPSQHTKEVATPAATGVTVGSTVYVFTTEAGAATDAASVPTLVSWTRTPMEDTTTPLSTTPAATAALPSGTAGELAWASFQSIADFVTAGLPTSDSVPIDELLVTSARPAHDFVTSDTAPAATTPQPAWDFVTSSRLDVTTVRPDVTTAEPTHDVAVTVTNFPAVTTASADTAVSSVTVTTEASYDAAATATIAPTTDTLDVVEIEINRQAASALTGSTAAETTTEAFSSLAVEAVGTTVLAEGVAEAWTEAVTESMTTAEATATGATAETVEIFYTTSALADVSNYDAATEAPSAWTAGDTVAGAEIVSATTAEAAAGLMTSRLPAEATTTWGPSTSAPAQALLTYSAEGLPVTDPPSEAVSTAPTEAASTTPLAEAVSTVSTTMDEPSWTAPRDTVSTTPAEALWTSDDVSGTPAEALWTSDDVSTPAEALTTPTDVLWATETASSAQGDAFTTPTDVLWTTDAASRPMAEALTAPAEALLWTAETSTRPDAFTTLTETATTPTEALWAAEAVSTTPAEALWTTPETITASPPMAFTVVAYPLPGSSVNPVVVPLTPTSGPVQDFNYYDGVAFEDGGGSPADGYIPDYDGRSDEYDGDYFSDAAGRQRPPLSPPPSSDTKGLEIASLVREPPPSPPADNHRRSDVLPEDDDPADADDVSNDVGFVLASTAAPAKYADSFEGHMLRRMVPLVVRQLRMGHLSPEDMARLQYIFGPIWPEVEQLAPGRDRRNAAKYPHFKKWRGGGFGDDARPPNGTKRRRGRPAHRRPAQRRRPQKHATKPTPTHKRSDNRAPVSAPTAGKKAKHQHVDEDVAARVKRSSSAADEDVNDGGRQDDDYDYEEENDEDYLGDDRDYYEADDEEDAEEDISADGEDDEDEDLARPHLLEDDRDNPSVMELHYRSRQAQGDAQDVQDARGTSPLNVDADVGEDMVMDGADYEYY